MFCPSCGSKIDENMEYCPYCGTKLPVISRADISSLKNDVNPTYLGDNATTPSPTSSPTPSYKPTPDPQQPTNTKMEMTGNYPVTTRSYAPKTPFPSYQPIKQRTGWLTFVLVMNWIGIAIAIVLTLILLAYYPPLAALVIILILFEIWITIALGKYSNTARIITIILTVLAIPYNLYKGNVIGLITNGLFLYALAFHQPTVALFKQDVNMY